MAQPRPNPADAAQAAVKSHEETLQEKLREIARQIRYLSIAGIYHAGSGHPGGSLSCADLLAALYGGELRLDPERPEDPERDRFVLSKGHAAPALYGAWAATGLLDPEETITLRKMGARLQGHPHVLDTPLAETSTGSLGQGFSVAIGMALGLRHKGSDARVYTVLGDGELQEGEVWEGAMAAGHHRIGNLCALIDYNKMQSDARCEEILALEPLAEKWWAFNWNVIEIDGHTWAKSCALFEARNASATGPALSSRTPSRARGFPSWKACRPGMAA